MSHAAHALPALETVEDYKNQTEFSPPGNRRYRVEQTRNGVFHHEIAVDQRGKVIYDQAVQVHLAIGSGRRGRSYLIERGDKYFVSPIAWYTEKKRWALSPGYPPGQHQRFERRATDVCLNCHVGRLANLPGSAHRFRSPAILEFGIGCERCHGPARGHVEFHRGRITGGKDPIVNPAGLSPAKRDSVCNQCHLQGDDIIPRYGRSVYDFRPSMHTNEVWSVVVAGARVGPDGTTSAVSHVEQMRASRCYQNSAGKFGCISCHDPHRSPSAENRAAFYRNQCLKCHQSPQAECALDRVELRKPPASNSCIHCHMPRLSTNDIPHTTQSDHRILRFASKSPAENSPPDDGLPRLFDHAASPLPAVEVQRARGIALARRAQQTGDRHLSSQAIQMLRPVLGAAPDDVAVLMLLGQLHSHRNQPALAVEFWNRALSIEPRNEQLLSDLILHHFQNRQYSRAREMVRRYLKINVWHADIYFWYAQLLAVDGDYAAAIEQARHCLKLDPRKPGGYRLLVRLYEKTGKPSLANRYRQLLARLR